MPLVLGAIVLFVLLGLLTPRLGRRVQAGCAAIAIGVALTYLAASGIN